MKNLLLLFTLIYVNIQLNAQPHSEGWKVDYSKSKSFIENKGQFDSDENEFTGKIRYAIDFGATRIYFGEKGVTYGFRKLTKKSKEERKQILAQGAKSFQDHKQSEKLIGKFLVKTDQVNLLWKNPSSKCEIKGLGTTADYHSYTFQSSIGDYISENHIKGCEKLVYENLYPNIDLEYTVHPIIGVKYAYILHPGANLNDIDLAYDRAPFIDNGEIHISTLFGDIIDHAPVTFYEDDENDIIPSSYSYHNGHVTFKLAEYDDSKTVVIDPWVQTPNFALDWDVVWECDYDGSGNVYVIGGIDNMQLLKYNSTGALQWTHNTPYDTINGDWLGALIVDDAGTSYVTQGVDARIEKVDAAGNVVFYNASPGGPGIGISTEFWTLAFNCDQTKLTTGGAGGNLNIHGRVYDINTNNGDVNSTSMVTAPMGITIPPNFQEIRGMSAAPNGKYYFITLDSIGYISDNLALCPNNEPLFKTNSGFSWGYYTDNWRTGNSGLKVIRADSNYVYVHRGNQLQRRSLVDLSVITTVSIPNGVFQNQIFNGNQNHNAGLDIDQCGNIYVGSTDGVYVYNSLMAQTGFYPTAYTVYDVRVNTNGEIIACGGTGDETSNIRSGGVQTFGASACLPISFTCCNTAMCIPDTLCDSDLPISIVAAEAGGVWSGGAYINSSGSFDPSIAGPGVHPVTYTLSCGSETIMIVVESCPILSICEQLNGDLTASGGTGVYSWSYGTVNPSTSINTEQECIDCIFATPQYIGFPPFAIYTGCDMTTCPGDTTWTQYATGVNTLAPPSYPILISDGNVSTTIDNAGELVACSVDPCAGVTLTMNVVSQSDPNCFGGMDGSATVSATGGIAPYTYTWSPGSMSGATQNSLGEGTYTISIQDANGCLDSGTVVIGEPNELIASATTTMATCGNSDGTATGSASGGTGSLTYAWTPSGGTGLTATGLAPGSYTFTVTDQNNCSANTTITITTAGGPTLSLDNSSDPSCFGGTDGSATVSATGGSPSYSYNWMPGSLSGSSQSTLSSGTYTVTVTDQSGCSDVITLTLNEPAEISLDTTNLIPANCGTSDGSASVIAGGGTGSYSYLWSPQGGTSSTANNIPGGAYVVTVTDQNNCTADISFTLPTIGGPMVSILSSTNVSCYSLSDGEANALATGGTTPYTYVWSPSGATGANATGLNAGVHTLTVTDAGGCVGTVSVSISEPSEIDVVSVVTDENCGLSDGAISLTVSGGSPGYSYLWSPGQETTSAITGITNGNYNVQITDNNGCIVSDNFIVSSIGTIPINAIPEVSTINLGESVQLNVSGGTSYSWSPSSGLDCDDCDNPIASPTVTTTYIVIGVDENGCTGMDTVTIYVEQSCGDLYVPNIFSPNGMGPAENEQLCVYGSCIAELQYTVFNRWGEMVFETNSVDNCWDGNFKGKPAITGVYAYKLHAVLFNGDVVEDHGNVTLTR